jgi:hypothetical protein
MKENSIKYRDALFVYIYRIINAQTVLCGNKYTCYIWVFFRKFRVVSVFFGLLRNSSVCFGCFDIGSKHRNKPKLFVFGFTKQTETNAKQILFRFVSVQTEIYFCSFRGHPSRSYAKVRNYDVAIVVVTRKFVITMSK